MQSQVVDLRITVINLTGTAWIATTNLGGIQIRGPRSDTAVNAVRLLCQTLSPQGIGGQSFNAQDDAATGLELLLAGVTLDEAMNTSDAKSLNPGE